MKSRFWLVLAAAGALALGVAACGDDDEGGSISIDGSSTVFPFGQAAAEEFKGEDPDVKITVAQSGTGGGFEKFCAGEIDISEASRPIEDDEKKACADKGIKYKEVQVANDGLAVVTSKDLKIDCMTVENLKKLWNKGSSVKNYDEVGGPNAPVSLYGAGTDSGTFDYFTEQINGEEGASRKDYQPSEDDNVLVEGVSGDKNGLAYFGFSYFEQNQDKLNLVGIDSGSGCLKPSIADVQTGKYKPLSRPLFMYVSDKALKDNDNVKKFMDYVLENYDPIAKAAQIVPMTPEQDEKAKQALGS
jgi:phosphate transport system substrate-binding protein